MENWREGVLSPVPCCSRRVCAGGSEPEETRCSHDQGPRSESLNHSMSSGTDLDHNSSQVRSSCHILPSSPSASPYPSFRPSSRFPSSSSSRLYSPTTLHRPTPRHGYPRDRHTTRPSRRWSCSSGLSAFFEASRRSPSQKSLDTGTSTQRQPAPPSSPPPEQPSPALDTNSWERSSQRRSCSPFSSRSRYWQGGPRRHCSRRVYRHACTRS